MTAPLTPPATPAVTGRRALLVDDEKAIRHAIRRFFERQGWIVDEAADGTAALALLLGPGAAVYEVILSDLHMPGMNGEELYDRVAAERPAQAARMVVTTGDAFTDSAVRFLHRTKCAVLNKPFDFAELRAVVERVTGRP